MKTSVRNLAFSVLMLFFAGCASVADLAGYDSRTLNLQSEEKYREMLGSVSQSIDRTSPTARRVQTVFTNMVPAANAANRTGLPFHWEMNVIRQDELNAGAMPGGKMILFTGIVERLNLSDEEIAAVIGHEMAHALREHTKQQAGQQILMGVGLSIGSQVLAGSSGVSAETAKMATQGGALLAQLGLGLPFSRAHEKEADIDGIMLMAQSGYDPAAAITLWQKMSAQASKTPEFLSTHPSGSTRIQDLQTALPQAQEYYRAYQNAKARR